MTTANHATFTLGQLRDALGPELLSETPGSVDFFGGVCNDSRRVEPGELFVALRTEARDGHAFVADAVARGAAGVVVQEEVPLPAGAWSFRVRDSRHAIGELARAYRNRFILTRSVVITGNTGKTTTKELTAAVLGRDFRVLKSHANFNDEVGMAMTLFDLDESHQRLVLEAGMFELGEIARLCQIARPDTSVVLNVGPTHLERLGSLEAIASAKAEAVEALSSQGNALLNADDPYVAAMASKTKARVMSFGTGDRAELRATDIRSRGLAGVDFRVECAGRSLEVHSPLPGRGLVSNALAAIGVGFVEGMALEHAAHALSQAQVPARLQAKLAPSGATILDDCYNAGPASMLAALEVLSETPGRRLALLGDMLELGSAAEESHRSVGERAGSVTDGLFTVGELGALIAGAARAAGAPFVRHFDSKDEASAELASLLQPGDVLLIKASHGIGLETVVAELMQA